MRVAASILFLLTVSAALALDQRAALLLDDLPSADGILAEYQIFDNADDSARLNHAALGNGASAHSRRLWFDGADDYVAVAQSVPAITGAPFTVTAVVWQDASGTSDYPAVVSDGMLMEGYRWPGFLLRYARTWYQMMAYAGNAD